MSRSTLDLIGFDWVCFPEGSGGADFHNPLLVVSLRSSWAFGELGLNWVCFGGAGEQDYSHNSL